MSYPVFQTVTEKLDSIQSEAENFYYYIHPEEKVNINKSDVVLQEATVEIHSIVGDQQNTDLIQEAKARGLYDRDILVDGGFFPEEQPYETEVVIEPDDL